MRKKTLSRVLALCFVLFAANATAQEGLFQRGMSDEAYYGFGNAKEDQSLFNNRSVETTGVIDNQTFGQEVPVSSGVILLLAAGAGYAILKRKEDEQ